jgi:hypothetical protein
MEYAQPEAGRSRLEGNYEEFRGVRPPQGMALLLACSGDEQQREPNQRLNLTHAERVCHQPCVRGLWWWIP